MGARRWVGWLALLLGALAPAAMAQKVATSGQEGLPAPAFTASPVNGGSSISLRKLVSGVGGVVAFVDHRSRDGLRLAGYIQAQYKAWKDERIGAVLIVNSATVRDTVSKWAEENSLTVPVIHDQGNTLSRQFGLDGLAMAMVINHDGVITKRAETRGDNTDVGPLVGQAVQSLLDDQKTDATGGGASQPGTLGAAGTGPAVTPGATPAAPGTPGATPGATPGTAPAVPAKPALPAMSEAEAHERIAKGLQLLQRGYSQAVLEEARLIVARRPADPLALLWLAYALEATRSYPEAAVTYRELVRLVPGHAYAAAALQRIDPTGRWRTPADLPGALPPVTTPAQAKPGGPAPPAPASPPPAPPAAKEGGDKPTTSGQGSVGIGD